jgi:radical SAM superfamily enzyme YgiQ (UPF0313 family)
MTDIFLINPPFGNQNMKVKMPFGNSKEGQKMNLNQLSGRIATPPLGLMYIAAYLRVRGITSKIIDMRLKPLSITDFKKLLEEESPRLVGIHTLTEIYDNSLAIARAVKQWRSHIPVVMGGPHVTFIDQEPLETGAVDVVVRGEGEETMWQLTRALFSSDNPDLARIPGITFAHGSGDQRKITRNPPRTPISDLDTLPLPARELIDLKHYFRSGIMITSRGCPYRCLFCSVNTLTDGKYRYRSVDAVVEEMFYLNQQLNFPMVAIVDDTISAYKNRLPQLCKQLIAKQFPGEWTCQLRVNEVTPDILLLMKESGCTNLQFGIESGNDEVLKAIRKGITVKQMDQAMKWAHEAGIKIKCSAIVGHHADTPESINDTVRLLTGFKDQYDARVSIGINTPLPGTFIYNNHEELGIKIHSRKWSEYIVGRAIIDTKHLSRMEIQQHYAGATLKTTAMDYRTILNSMAGNMGNLDFDTVTRLMATNTINQPPYGGHITPWVNEVEVA